MGKSSEQLANRSGIVRLGALSDFWLAAIKVGKTAQFRKICLRGFGNFKGGKKIVHFPLIRGVEPIFARFGNLGEFAAFVAASLASLLHDYLRFHSVNI